MIEDVFGLPESIVSLPELVALMMNAVSPRERPMGKMDATPFAVSLSMSYNWLSTLVRTNVHTPHTRMVIASKNAVCIRSL